jgi:hypothetical protein
MSSRDTRRDDELEERLDELEDVLTELRRDLRESGGDRREPPRPPSLSELLRFTERYTIPTVIALLETTIKSLELLRGTLRLADPGRSVADDAGATADRLADVRDGASAGLARSLSELRTALSEADLPEEAASRSIIAEARDLTAEIESRIEEGRRQADDARGRRTDEGSDDGRDAAERDRGIRIDVTDPDAAGDAEADAGDDSAADPAPEVDVESELESIKREVDGEEIEKDETGDDAATEDDESGDAAGDDTATDEADDAAGEPGEDADRDGN